MIRKKDYQKLSTFLLNLTINEYNLKKSQIITNCGISTQVFNNWRSGRTEIPNLAKREINKIAKCDVFEL